MRSSKRQQRFPTVGDLRRRARLRIPRFAFDYVDGGANEEICARRNLSALAAVELLPRYCVEVRSCQCEVELFGHRYAAPFGIAPMGSAGLAWPGAERYMALEAQRRNIPYVHATPSTVTIEEVAKICPDVLWFQLYRFRDNDHAITYDLMRRAARSGARALVLTVDTPLGVKRPRDIRNGVSIRTPFRTGLRELFQIASRPAWLLQVCRVGTPKLVNLAPYSSSAVDRHALAKVMAASGGGHRWDEIGRLRDLWKKPLIVKGLLHPRDAERAVSLGVDGVVVSNHGGRTFDGAPAAIDILPAVVTAVGTRVTVLFDSGIRSGLDIVRALALGAVTVFIGRPVLFGLSALGNEGASYVISMIFDELRAQMAHIGGNSVSDIRKTDLRHSTEWTIP